MNMKQSLVLLLLFSAAVVGIAQDQPSKTYPEHGTVVTVRARKVSPGMVFGTGSEAAEPTVSVSRGSCRIETQTRFYEFSASGKLPKFTVGQTIDFRIDRKTIYIPGTDDREHKYRLLAIGQKTDSAKE